MKVIKITVQGARGLADIIRRDRSVVVELAVGDGSSPLVISRDDWRGEDHRSSWRCAARLHQLLEGFEGCAGDVAPYRQVLEYFFG